MATGTKNRSITKITKVYISLLIFMIETQNWCQNVQNNIVQVIIYSLCKKLISIFINIRKQNKKVIFFTIGSSVI